MAWVASRSDAFINQAEIALDYCFDIGADRDDAADFLDQRLIRRWHGKLQLIKKLYTDWQGRTRLSAQSRYDAGRWAPNSLVLYKEEEFSRITGELNCLHIEWRLCGGRALRSAGIYRGQI